MPEKIDSDALEKARADALASDRSFSKNRLKNELRLKPKPDAEPVKELKNRFGTWCKIYRVADCVPMRMPAEQPAQSPAQIAQRQRFGRESYLKSRRGKAGARAADWLAGDTVFLDTETTGLGADDQIVEIAITDLVGAVVFESLVRPTVPVGAEAANVHGITDAELASAPAWPGIADQVRDAVQGKTVVIFNEDFDGRMLAQTADAHGARPRWVDQIKSVCAMQLAADYYGATNRYGTISLANALDAAGIGRVGDAHRASGDAASTAALVKAISEAHKQRIGEAQ